MIAAARHADDNVTVVIPVRDEAGTIGDVLASLAAQTISCARLDVRIYDGRSVDETRSICERWRTCAAWNSFEVVDNPSRTVPYALNAGLAQSNTRWFMRLDGRTALGHDYIERCVDAARDAGENTAAAGSFRVLAECQTPIARAIAAVVCHPWAVGKGFRTATPTTEKLDHHPFAVWSTNLVRCLGGFDARLTRNQDDEFCLRAVRAGATIVHVPSTHVSYSPRTRLRGLALQYLQYGLWKAVVGRRTLLFPKRSIAPAMMVFACAGAVALAASGLATLPLITLLLGYVLAGAQIARLRPGSNPLLVSLTLGTLHVSYGAGIIAGAVWPRASSSRIATSRSR